MLPTSKILWALVNNLVELSIGFGTIVLVTRQFTSDEAGTWILFTSIFLLLSKLREGFVQTALVKFSVGVEKEERNSILKSNLIINMCLEIALSTIIWIIGMMDFFPSISELLVRYPIYAIPWSIYRWILTVFRSQLNVKIIFKINTVILISLSVGGGCLFTFNWPLEFMVIILGVCSFNASLLGLYLINTKQFLKSKINWKHFKKQFYFGNHGILRELTGTLSNRINVFLTAGFLTFSDTALLGVAQRYTQLVLLPNTAIQSLLFPKACEIANSKDVALLKQLFEGNIARLLAVFIPLVSGISLFSHFLITFLNGPEYVPAAGLLVIMIVTIGLFAPFGNGFGSMVNAITKPHLNTQVVVVNSIINIILSVILVKNIGIYGAVIAPFLSELIGFIWIGKILKKELNIDFINCFQQIPTQYKILFVNLKKFISSKTVSI
ncbi:polysaccharide biosynthesis C-terminal domain-containing protein [Flexithrix dorotheae]|uniref:oligosaccharide flippase family protein n=1 Tax=Flexithrix dorotheae TaxID=70993 RepID=UPI0003759081|nr:polysaccharide biosynthesis C-terminal domain-containing protein [Flexithrix dorotheae]